MKVGDIVELRDGSYHMTLLGGELKHHSGLSHQAREYRVVGTHGAYPTDRPVKGSYIPPLNDMMLVDVSNPGFVLFTRGGFCIVVTSPQKKLPEGQLEITIPRGTKGVRLILQQERATWHST